MRTPSRPGLVRSLAIVLAMIGAMFVAAPQGAQAAPAMVSTQVAGPAEALTQVQYGGWRHHPARSAQLSYLHNSFFHKPNGRPTAQRVGRLVYTKNGT